MNFAPIIVTQANRDFAISTNIRNAIRALSTKMRNSGGYPLQQVDAGRHKIEMVGASDEDHAALTYSKWVELWNSTHP